MPNPSSLDHAETEARIIELFKQDHTFLEIKKITGAPWNRISRTLQDAGLSASSQLPKVQSRGEATRAENQSRLESIKNRRLQLAELLTDDAFRMRERAWSEYSEYIVTQEGPVEIVHDEPPLREQADAMKAVQAAVNTVDDIIDGMDSGDKKNSHNVLATIVESLTKAFTDDPDAGLSEGDQEPTPPEDDDQ